MSPAESLIAVIFAAAGLRPVPPASSAPTPQISTNVEDSPWAIGSEAERRATPSALAESPPDGTNQPSPLTGGGQPAPATASTGAESGSKVAPVGSIPDQIRQVFGPAGAEAVAVASCETGGTFSTTARNGRHLGLFQMGARERAAYGHGPDAITQIEAAHRYWLVSGWRPWKACRGGRNDG